MNCPSGIEWYTYILKLLPLFPCWALAGHMEPATFTLKGFIVKPCFQSHWHRTFNQNNLFGFEFKETSRQS